MKILHLIHRLNPGGVERFLLQMLSGVSQTHCVMDVCCRSNKVGRWDADAQKLGANVLKCPVFPNFYSYISRLRQIFLEGDYDIIHCHLVTQAGTIVRLANQLGLKVVITVHSTQFHPKFFLTKLPVVSLVRRVLTQKSLAFAIGNSHRIVAVSGAVLNSLIQIEPLAGSVCDIIPHGVAYQSPTKLEETVYSRESVGLPEGAFIITHIGRFVPSKNHHAIIKIFDMIHDSVPNAILLLVGDGSLRLQIERAVSKHHWKDRVFFLGYRDDVQTLLRLSDVMVFPSFYEGFGLVCIEAASAGLPVVASRISPLDEIILDGVTGMLHDINDLKGFANSIYKLYSNHSLRTELGEAARLRVNKHFSLDKTVGLYIDLYSSLIDSMVPRSQSIC